MVLGPDRHDPLDQEAAVAHRLDFKSEIRGRIQLAPQVSEVDVDHVLVRGAVRPPKRIEDRATRQGLTGRGAKKG